MFGYGRVIFKATTIRIKDKHTNQISEKYSQPEERAALALHMRGHQRHRGTSLTFVLNTPPICSHGLAE